MILRVSRARFVYKIRYAIFCFIIIITNETMTTTTPQESDPTVPHVQIRYANICRGKKAKDDK